MVHIGTSRLSCLQPVLSTSGCPKKSAIGGGGGGADCRVRVERHTLSSPSHNGV